MNTTLKASTTRVAATARRSFAAAASDASLVKTALFDLHKQLGGDMVPFAGYELPVLYKGDNGGVMKEHLWCRTDNCASLFDVSHMGQVRRSFTSHFVDATVRNDALIEALHVLHSLLYKDSLAWR